MRTKLSAVVAGAGLLVAVVPAAAHHSFAAEFDGTKPVHLRGTVTKMEWINPHSWLYVDVKDEKGQVVQWAIEAGAPNAMFRRGFRKESLPPGTEIIIDGFQSKTLPHTANGRDLTFPDGRKLFMGSAGTGAPGDPK